MTVNPNHHPAPITIEGRRLQGRVILITGASAGMGAAATRRFAAEGAHVIAGARRTDRLAELAAELSTGDNEVVAVPLDVTDEASVEAAVALAVTRFGRLDGALNAAGVTSDGTPVHQKATATYDRVMDINAKGVFLSMKHEIPAMLAAGGGSIVNVSSIGGMVGVAGISEYVASKWAVNGLTKSAALELAPFGVRVNALAPGSTRTEMWDQLPVDFQMHLAAMAPMNQIALPDDMARAALFLLSDESRWTTGAVLPAEGGHHVGR
ncbi:putative short-chain dehydrogenase [Actinoplanes missouriensis 431]|uniref:Putative short-chain dehydrogenase n=1 Tax=Actinoplanes missouriensis (strain ATCC 14538 / DSM 43046 / CBS 188.64 / JCM 3121 / NBRC 102363 / NCIMB 12654 / NRRL B-3342 / UNCC 431) TaxID=512565 RepID=I0H5T7_ACTM4|nr:SDR family NAD(P)-dependent oxidoreductase [Actinoplanes missouriensis]BAL88374.1 putative short-chain dehydrogenase [Actinoplanes missouriensis 431]